MGAGMESKEVKFVPNKKAEFVVKVLKEYAYLSGNIPRSTSDLSPLEQYLLMELYKAKNKGG